MEWDKKDQAIFEITDKGLGALRRNGWLSWEKYNKIQSIIDQAIKTKEQEDKEGVKIAESIRFIKYTDNKGKIMYKENGFNIKSNKIVDMNIVLEEEQ